MDRKVINLEEERIMRTLKKLVREMEWSDRQDVKFPRERQFHSHCMIEETLSEDIVFRMHYLPPAKIPKGETIIETQEECTIALFYKDRRIFAIDKQPGHRNKNNKGRPYDKQRISAPVHIHPWTETDGYAEPLPLDDDSPEKMLEEFLERAILELNGHFVHPMKGVQERMFNDL